MTAKRNKEENLKYRYRLTFSKGYRVKYVAHLDMLRAWTRAFRRAGVPLAYTKGFNPQAKIQIAASLPLGSMGSAEMMDIYLSEAMEPSEILARMNSALPEGFELSNVESVDPKAPALQAELLQADYTVTVESDLSANELNNRIESLLNADKVIQTRIRRRKEESFDLRPLLHSLKLKRMGVSEARLIMRLSTGQQGNLRPEAALKALGLGESWRQIERHKLIFGI